MEVTMAEGHLGRLGFVDLSTGEVREEKLEKDLAREYIGGYGLGVRTLFERQKKGADPLGPESILGFTTGPLTGTKAPTGGRYTVVCKSPLTGGWGDANAGGFFGSELRAAGWDAIFVSGAASSPVSLLIRDERMDVVDASHLWGRDTAETEDILRKDLNLPRLRVACIGPASEKLSLISGIVNDKGRVAARSGVGAVMGSKQLKAVAVQGTGTAPVAHKKILDLERKSYLRKLREAPGFHKVLMRHGTCGITGDLVRSGATPVKNWLLAGEQAFPNLDNVADGDSIIQYQVKKYACANCPIGCGGIFSVGEGTYRVTETHKPEYETVAAFGPMCLNDNFLSIVKLHDMCNRSGLDTISAGSVIAFAMECHEKGIITRNDADGIDLTWGNAEAMVALLDKIIRREGLGDVLADGVRAAAKRIGKGAEECAIHVGGQEPGLHNALFLPGRGTGFVCDPTPGRHTATPMARLDAGVGAVAPYPELQFHGFERYDYKSKGAPSATTSCYWQVGACAGVCLFPVIFFGNYPLIEFLNAVTDWNMDMKETLETGARIQTLRLCFNMREAIEPAEIRLPSRLVGIPPKGEGPLAGLTIDIDTLTQEYREAMGWDPKTGYPTQATLRRLRLEELVAAYGNVP
jgi:aldehyde:ferredoxin oxidoreductase